MLQLRAKEQGGSIRSKACAGALWILPPPWGHLCGRLGYGWVKPGSLFICKSMVYNIQIVLLNLWGQMLRKDQAVVPGKKPLALLVHQKALGWAVAPGLNAGFGLCLQDVSRRVNWSLINKFANQSSPLGILLVCHNLLFCSLVADSLS